MIVVLGRLIFGDILFHFFTATAIATANAAVTASATITANATANATDDKQTDRRRFLSSCSAT